MPTDDCFVVTEAAYPELTTGQYRCDLATIPKAFLARPEYEKGNPWEDRSESR